MSTAIKCDRCGCGIKRKDAYIGLLKKTERFQVLFWNTANQKERDVDLCPSCFAEFERWLKGGTTDADR